MRCRCCNSEISLARKVQLLLWRAVSGPDDLVCPVYGEGSTYYWAFVCDPCYLVLDNDNEDGVAKIGGAFFKLDSPSRGDKAAVVNAAEYQAFQRRRAENMGLAD